MNTKNLLVAAGLLFLATACKNNDTVKPQATVPVVSSPAPVKITPTDDSLYTNEGKGTLIKLKPAVPVKPTPPYRGDEMPIVQTEPY